MKKKEITAWTVPLNVVMVENTFGGTNANMCHGAGIGNQTMSDLVTEIEFVNANGELQTIGYNINDPIEKQQEGRELIKTAAGCFGMLGVVTSITMKLDEMKHARLQPKKIPIGLAVPPPSDFKFPSCVPSKFFADIAPQQMEQARVDFIKRCQKYYAEEFWFPFSDEGFTNAWNIDGDPKQSVDYPGDCIVETFEAAEFLAGLANKTIMQALGGKDQAKFLSKTAMFTLPDGGETITPVVDAIHFRGRGVQNMVVQNFELEIPIPADKDGNPDWSLCQRAWWDGIVTVYEWAEKGFYPMRLPLEMRIMGDSNMTMAAQRGNKHGTCSIEVLTTELGLVNEKEWLGFMQALMDKWSKYTDIHGNPLNVRPHPAKQWKGLTIQRAGEKRMSMEEYIKKVAYKDAIPEFKKHLEIIAKKGGSSLKDLSMFSNSLLDNLIYDKKKQTQKQAVEDKKPLEEKCLTPRSSAARLENLFQKAKASHFKLVDRVSDVNFWEQEEDKKEEVNLKVRL